MASGPPDVMASQEPAEAVEECSGNTLIKYWLHVLVLYFLLELAVYNVTNSYDKCIQWLFFC